MSGGDLFSYLVKNVQLSAAECKWIMYQLLLAVEYLHEIGNVAHRGEVFSFSFRARKLD